MTTADLNTTYPMQSGAPLDRRQFGRKLRDMLPSLFRYASSLARDRELAEDLVQDTAMRAWQHRERFVAGTNMKAWLFTILRNCFLSHVRRGRVAKTYTYGDELPDIPVASNQENSVVLKDVRRLWARLTTDQRRAIELIAFEGKTYEEAAVIEDISIGTLKSRVSRGRHALHSMLDERRDCKSSPAISSGDPLHYALPNVVSTADAASAPALSKNHEDLRQIEMLRRWRSQREAPYMIDV